MKKKMSEPIRVLHFVSQPTTWNGVMSVIMNYYRNINRTLIQFDFLCFTKGVPNYEEEIRSLGGQVYYINKPKISCKTFKELNDFFEKYGSEYVWLENHEVYLTFILRPISKFWGIENFIIHCHATRFSDRLIAGIRNRLLCLPIAVIKKDRGVKLVACSRKAAEFLYGKNTKAIIFHNAINEVEYTFNSKIRVKLRKEIGIENELVVCMVGRLVPQKNPFFLLDVAERVKSEIENMILIIVGDGYLKEQMAEEVKKRNLEKKVLFLGIRNDVKEFLNAIDIFVLPSLYEGLPMSAVEAQANGIPCLLSNKITDEVCINKNVQILELDEKLWARQIGQLKNYDINERENFSLNFINKAKDKHFSIKTESGTYEKLILNERL